MPRAFFLSLLFRACGGDREEAVPGATVPGDGASATTSDGSNGDDAIVLPENAGAS